MAGPEVLPQIPVAAGRLPVVGHLLKTMRDQHAFLTRNEAEHGPLFWIDSGFGGWQLVVGGEGALDCLKNRTTSSDAFPEIADYILDDTLLPAEGKTHKRMRGAMNPPFTPAGLDAGKAGQIVAEVVDKRIADWGERDLIKIVAAAGDITLDVIFRLIGVPSEELSTWRDKYQAFILGATPFPLNVPGSPRWRGLRARDWLDGKAGRYLDEVRRTHEQRSLLGALAHGVDDEGSGLTEAELLANLRVLGIAGHETTASTLSWAMLFLGHHPEDWDALVEEAEGQDAPVSPQDLARFPFAEAVFREALRLYPPLATVLRRTVAPTEVNHVVVPAGVDVQVSVWSLSRDPERYPEPGAFRPRRWFDLGRKPGPAESFQFGGGPHFCLGYHLAVLEGVWFLARVARVLAAANKRPFAERFPRPTFFPLTRPPNRTTVDFVPVDAGDVVAPGVA